MPFETRPDTTSAPCGQREKEWRSCSLSVSVYASDFDRGPGEPDPQVVEAGFALVVLALVLGAAVQVLKLPIVRRRFKSSKASSKDLV